MNVFLFNKIFLISIIICVVIFSGSACMLDIVNQNDIFKDSIGLSIIYGTLNVIGWIFVISVIAATIIQVKIIRLIWSKLSTYQKITSVMFLAFIYFIGLYVNYLFVIRKYNPEN